jgi:hypothetical protein
MSRPGLEVLEHTANCDIDMLILNLSRFMGLGIVGIAIKNGWHGVSE